MADLFELSWKARRAKVREAVDGVLRSAGEPMGSGELVKAVAKFMGLNADEQKRMARLVTDLAPDHPSARQTGETFKKYGREMRRWEWLPIHAKPGLPKAELERRRRKIASQEAADDDMWTVHPEPPGLEDEDA